MSLINNKNSAVWTVGEAADPAAVEAVSAGLGISEPMARLLCKRGCSTPESARAFIRMEEGVLHDPFLLPDMDKAVERIEKAIETHEKIVIFGDYDADGVTSVSVLYLYLSERGADVGYFIPRRSEGYGMSRDAVTKLAEEGASLIITVDTGISAKEEIGRARELGVDVVVTDHHECIVELPCACAVVNPQRRDSGYPFRGLAGVGVTYKLVCALESVRRCGDLQAATLGVSERFADLVAIGTVADVMPVLDENRIIVSYGLRMMERSARPGVRALIDACTSSDGAGKPKKPKFNTGFISFTLAPRINAAGRMGDASLAAELFLSRDAAEAAAFAEKLCEVNRERQRLENQIAEEAYSKIEATHDFEHDPVIVVEDSSWHNGIIGIVASRVTEKYGRPAILITFEGGDGKTGKGSGRSVRGLDLASALGECSDCLVKCGGHELAAGLTLEAQNLDIFKKRINDIARRAFADKDVHDAVTADDMLSEDEITLSFADELSMLEPFGIGNPTPLFLTEGLRVLGVTGVGGGRHTRLTLEISGSPAAAMYFSVSPEEVGLAAGDFTDILYNLETNEFRGERTAQIMIRAARKSGAAADTSRRIYFAMRSGEAGDEYYKYIPERAEMAKLFRALRDEAGKGRCVFTVPEAAVLAGGLDETKVMLALDIFSELDILRVRESPAGVYTVGFPPPGRKVDLEASSILGALRRQYRSK